MARSSKKPKLPTSTHPTKKKSFFQRISIAELFAPKPSLSVPREIYVHALLPSEAFDEKKKRNKLGHLKVKPEWVWSSNQIVTSKYSFFSFLPRNLLEQFRRVANVFFLFINILQCFSQFSTISIGLVFLPLIFVLFVTAAKDGYEDVKRHQSDRAVNHSRTRVLKGINNNHIVSKTKTFVPGLPPGLKLDRLSKKGRQKYKAQKEEEATAKLKGTVLAAPEEDELSISETSDGLVPQNQPSITVTPSVHNNTFPPKVLLANKSQEDDDEWVETLWEDVKVGDIIKVLENEAFPADLMIISTSEEESIAFVETKNLDGETNLKSRHAVPALSHLMTPEQLKNASMLIKVDKPDVNMFRLNANVALIEENVPQKQVTVSVDMCLLRGTVLRNTAWVTGVVLMTGMDTKILLNAGGAPSKRSIVEKDMNPMVAANLILLAAVCVLCAVLNYVLENRDQSRGAYWTYDDNRSSDNPTINSVYTFFNALITFQNIVPISLYISIEGVKTVQALFIYMDREIYYEKKDTPTTARSWNLSDDLGQIEYIFSDKTGTLTQNAMIFRECSIGGKIYRGTPDLEAPDLEDLPGEVQENGDINPTKERELKKDSSSSSSTPSLSKKIKKDPAPFFSCPELNEDLKNAKSDQSKRLHAFFATLALCHTALTGEDEEGNLTYKAQSPDEEALVKAAADVGWCFLGRDRNIMRLRLAEQDIIEEYELLCVLEFSSARKRMSVILRKLDDDRKLFLLTKGADNVIFERLAADSTEDDIRKQTDGDLEAFASDGLRTLCLAYKQLGQEEYEEWAQRYHKATVSLDNREELIEEAADSIERGLQLLGATAIEDKLQDGVPETIADLKRAGIKIWVATGDKLETAIAIGYSTKLLSHDTNLIIVRGGEYGSSHSAYDQMKNAMEQFFPDEDIVDNLFNQPPALRRTNSNRSRPSMQNRRSVASGLSDLVGANNGNRPGGYSLIIDGAALAFALQEPFSKDLLLNLSLRCNAVICCRVSPLQKAQVVNLIQDGLGVTTLAIGDGANDVSMIQAAHIGVGISGEEGLQAVNSSDYAIAQFRYLKKLLLVHGHWSYQRNSGMVLNFFQKNLIFVAVLFWFQIYCGWSATYVIEYIYILLWNILWTIFPPIVMGLFDRILDHHLLMELPELYNASRERRYFGAWKFTGHMLDGIYQSIICFFFIFYIYRESASQVNGFDISMYQMSTTLVIATVFVANGFNAFNTITWTKYVVAGVLFGPVLIFLFTLVYSALPPSVTTSNVYGSYYFLFASVNFWFCLPLVFALSLLPNYLYRAYHMIYAPSDIEIIQRLQKENPNRDWLRDPMIVPSASSIKGKKPMDEQHEFQTRPSMAQSRRSMRLSEDANATQAQPAPIVRGSRTDMATGITGGRAGFTPHAEDNDVAIRRLQSRLSEHSNVYHGGLAPVLEAGAKPRKRGLSRNFGEGLRSLVGSITSPRRRTSSRQSTGDPSEASSPSGLTPAELLVEEHNNSLSGPNRPLSAINPISPLNADNLVNRAEQLNDTQNRIK